MLLKKGGKEYQALLDAVHRKLACAFRNSQKVSGPSFFVDSTIDDEGNADFFLIERDERRYRCHPKQQVPSNLVIEIAELLLDNKEAEAEALAKVVFPPYKGE